MTSAAAVARACELADALAAEDDAQRQAELDRVVSRVWFGVSEADAHELAAGRVPETVQSFCALAIDPTLPDIRANAAKPVQTAAPAGKRRR